MPDPVRLRNSTQIVLPWKALQGLCGELEREFTVTIHDEGSVARIIGSPLVIKDVSDFLVRRGVGLP